MADFFSVIIAIWQFINTLYIIVGYFTALQLSALTEELIKNSDALSAKQQIYALPTLGLIFITIALILLGGLETWVLISIITLLTITSLLWTIFGIKVASFIIGMAFFVSMPFIIKKLTFPILLWKDEHDDWLTCLFNTILIAGISFPALSIFFTEIISFFDGHTRTAHEFSTYILTPAIYTLIFFVNLKRNNNF